MGLIKPYVDCETTVQLTGPSPPCGRPSTASATPSSWCPSAPSRPSRCARTPRSVRWVQQWLPPLNLYSALTTYATSKCLQHCVTFLQLHASAVVMPQSEYKCLCINIYVLSIGHSIAASRRAFNCLLFHVACLVHAEVSFPGNFARVPPPPWRRGISLPNWSTTCSACRRRRRSRSTGQGSERGPSCRFSALFQVKFTQEVPTKTGPLLLPAHLFPCLNPQRPQECQFHFSPYFFFFFPTPFQRHFHLRKTVHCRKFLSFNSKTWV